MQKTNLFYKYICFPVQVTGIATTKKNARKEKKRENAATFFHFSAMLCSDSSVPEQF
jgi:glycerol-3-phosphate responsive antiterminator